MKRPQLKHNVIDRDKVVIPPNWDSWGKIRVLRDGFDVEQVSKGWALDISEDFDSFQDGALTAGAVALYEEMIQDSRTEVAATLASQSTGSALEVKSLDPQDFLAGQLEVLEKLRNNGVSSSREGAVRRAVVQNDGEEDGSVVNDGRVNEHIGPIQFNMGGIQVDAEDMLKRLKVSLFIYAWF